MVSPQLSKHLPEPPTMPEHLGLFPSIPWIPLPQGQSHFGPSTGRTRILGDVSKSRAVREELLSWAGSAQPSAPALDQPRCREAPADSHPAAAAGDALGQAQQEILALYRAE